MRILRIILEEVSLDKNTCYRAGRAIPFTELSRVYRHAALLKTVIEDLEEALNEEIKKHEQINISRPAVCTYPNPKDAPGADEAP
jgi:hypothetical protein